jgi:TRAP-type C4-dicarboxylate transport system substrate-binding protein
MKRIIFLSGLLFFCIAVKAPSVFAQRGGRTQGQKLEIKLANPLPEASPYGRAMNRIAAEWSRISGGEIVLRIIHGGLEGGEAKMFTSMSSNVIQGALFTTFGLTAICPPVMTLSVPFYIRNENELDAVLKETLPLLEAQVAKTDFFVLAWSKAGWVNIFSRGPVRVPDDLRKYRIATNAGSDTLNIAFETMGFKLEKTDLVDVAAKIANNTIGAVYQTPVALSYSDREMQKAMRNMMDVPISPFVGAIVIRKDVWNKISPDRQERLLRETRRIAAEFDKEMPGTLDKAVGSMVKSGLNVNKISGEEQALWQREIQTAIPELLKNNTFDKALYTEIGGILTGYRGGQ